MSVGRLENGSPFGPLVLETMLTEGPMGIVYRALQLPLGRPVAIKLVRPDWADDPATQARFRHEARAAHKPGGRAPRRRRTSAPCHRGPR